MPVYQRKGNVLEPQRTDDNAVVVIPHVCNDQGLWGAGFVMALNRKYGTDENSPFSHYRRWYLKYRNSMGKNGISRPFKLGETQMVCVGDNTIVANMIAQSDCGGNRFSLPRNRNIHLPPLDTYALRKCLYYMFQHIVEAKDTTPDVEYEVHCPKFGSGLAGGNWDHVERMLGDIAYEAEVDVYVYSYGE